MTLGTPAYMAPEQISADPHVDLRADVYSWGVMAYELLTGEPPFAGRSVQALLAAHVTEQPEQITRRRASIPPALAELVMRCLEKRPADRPQSADALLSALDALGPTTGVPTSSPPARSGISRPTRQRAAIAVALLGLAIAGFWRMRPSTADAAAQSIAVVPLTLGGADSSDYFADGIIETLIAALAKVPGLEVRPSAASLALRGMHLSDAEIGKSLHVQNVLHVSVRRSAAMMRIIVDLSRVQDAKVLWTDQQERPLADVFAVQDSIANRTANALAIHLRAGDRARMASFGTQSLEAYDFFLKGRHAIQRFDEPSLRLGLALFDSALARDPRYAQAYSSIAQVWLTLSDDWIAPREGYANAQTAAQHALEIDSTLGAARGFLAIARVTLDRDFKRGLREAEHGFRTDSLDAGSVFTYAAVLAFAGHADSSLALGSRAQALDPTNPTYHLVSGWTEFFRGHFDAAVAQYRAALAIQSSVAPAWNGMAEALLDGGHPLDALEALKRGTEQSTAQRSTLARTLAVLGRTTEAQRVTDALVADASRHYVSGDYIAAAYLALGNRDKAIFWLERANDDRSQFMLMARTDPRWKPLRDDSRFKTIVNRIGSD